MAKPIPFREFLTRLANEYGNDIAPGQTRLEVEKIKRAKYTDVIHALKLDFHTLTIIAFQTFSKRPFDPIRMPMQNLTFGRLYEFTVLNAPYIKG